MEWAWRRGWHIALPGIAALALVQLVSVPPTNFGGMDEWMVLELTSRGVVSVPYAFRPLGLVWALPAAHFVPEHGFAPYRWLFGIYLLGSAALVYALVARFLPGRRGLAFLAAALVVAWAPHDDGRVTTVESALYQGITFGMLGVLALFVEGWRRADVRLFAAAAVGAFALVRSYEGTAAVLAAAPLLAFLLPEARWRGRWAAAWEGALGAATAFVLLELAATPKGSAYQVVAQGSYPTLPGWLGRMARQLEFHLGPAVQPSLSELGATPVAVAAVLAVAGVALARRGDDEGAPPPRRLAAAAAAGLALALLGYAVILIGWGNPTAYRVQFLSGPGMAVFLAAAVELAASFAGRWRGVVAAAAAAWLVAIGTARTLAIKSEWDRVPVYARQVQMLAGLRQAVAGVAPGTLILALDDGAAWEASYAFHHAVQYLYRRHAAGFVPLRRDRLYTVAATEEGLLFQPWPILRRNWDIPARLHRYAEVLVVRHGADGQVIVLDAWPPELRPLPPGAVYAPRSRIVASPPRPLSVLDRPPGEPR